MQHDQHEMSVACKIKCSFLKPPCFHSSNASSITLNVNLSMIQPTRCKPFHINMGEKHPDIITYSLKPPSCTPALVQLSPRFDNNFPLQFFEHAHKVIEMNGGVWLAQLVSWLARAGWLTDAVAWPAGLS